MNNKSIGLEQWHLDSHLAGLTTITIHTKTKIIMIYNIYYLAGAPEG